MNKVSWPVSVEKKKKNPRDSTLVFWEDKKAEEQQGNEERIMRNAVAGKGTLNSWRVWVKAGDHSLDVLRDSHLATDQPPPLCPSG